MTLCRGEGGTCGERENGGGRRGVGKEGEREIATSGNLWMAGNVSSDLGGADHDQIDTAQCPCHRRVYDTTCCT